MGIAVLVAEVRGEDGRDTSSDVRVVVGQRETLEQFEVGSFGDLEAWHSATTMRSIASKIGCGSRHCTS